MSKEPVERLPDWISVSNIYLVSLKGTHPDVIPPIFITAAKEGIPLAIDDSLGADPGYVLRYLEEPDDFAFKKNDGIF